MHWPELHSLSGNDFDANSNTQRQNVINNPHKMDWFFTHRLEHFIKHWLYDTLDALWHSYRHECRGRGIIHSHGVAKLKNYPGLCDLTETALKGYVASKELLAQPDRLNELIPIIEEGKSTTAEVVKHADWLLSTTNPLPLDSEIWIKPDVHPCKRKHEDAMLSELSGFDYIDLLNSVQRHPV